MIDAGDFYRGRMVRNIPAEPLGSPVQIEEHGALPVVANHALDLKEGAYTRAAGNWAHVVEAGGRIQDHVAGRQLGWMSSVNVFDDQFTAVIFVGMGEEQRGRKIVRMRWGVPVTWRMALSTCVPKDWPPA